MRYWLDTEFIESGPNKPIFLLSIGIVAEDGRTLYIENKDAPIHLANPWVKANVIPHLDHFGGKCTHHGEEKECPALPFDRIKTRIREFVGEDRPLFWGYFADYDWVIFCQIFGSMIDLPYGWPQYCLDIVQVMAALNVHKIDVGDEYNHNALTDAIWTKKAFEFLEQYSKNQE